MLVDFEEEVGNVFVAVVHPLQPLDFVVDALGDGRCDPHQKKVQYEMPLVEKLLSQLHKGRNLGRECRANPLPEARLGGFTRVESVDFEELLFEQHGPVDSVVELSQLVQNITLSF